MLNAYKLYLKLTRGIMREADLPGDLSDLPAVAELPHTVRDVELNEELRDIVKTRYVLYLGRGESLHLDRKLIHDVVEKIHNRQGIHRAAVKSLQAAPSPIECGSRLRMLCWSAYCLAASSHGPLCSALLPHHRRTFSLAPCLRVATALSTCQGWVMSMRRASSKCWRGCKTPV